MLLMIMLSRLAKGYLFTVKTKNCAESQLTLLFITMALRKVMTLSLMIYFVLQRVLALKFLSVGKN